MKIDDDTTIENFSTIIKLVQMLRMLLQINNFELLN